MWNNMYNSRPYFISFLVGLRSFQFLLVILHVFYCVENFYSTLFYLSNLVGVRNMRAAKWDLINLYQISFLIIHRPHFLQRKKERKKERKSLLLISLENFSFFSFYIPWRGSGDFCLGHCQPSIKTWPRLAFRFRCISQVSRD